MFLATVRLNYGYSAINLIKTLGAQLLLVGAMSSTPRLAASMEALNDDDVTVFYGASYPFALFFKIIFTNILFKM